MKDQSVSGMAWRGMFRNITQDKEGNRREKQIKNKKHLNNSVLSQLKLFTLIIVTNIS